MISAPRRVVKTADTGLDRAWLVIIGHASGFGIPAEAGEVGFRPGCRAASERQTAHQFASGCQVSRLHRAPIFTAGILRSGHEARTLESPAAQTKCRRANALQPRARCADWSVSPILAQVSNLAANRPSRSGV